MAPRSERRRLWRPGYGLAVMPDRPRFRRHVFRARWGRRCTSGAFMLAHPVRGIACSARWPCPVDISSITIRLNVPIRWYTAGRPHAPMEPTVATATVSVRHTRYLDSLYERPRDVHSDARRAY